METGFDRHDPNARFLALLGFGLIVLLVAIVFGIQYYYDRVKEQQIYVQVLAPESETLKNLRAEEDEQLHSYRYIDRARGAVRLPIERAMELLAREQAAGKTFYPTTPYPVKEEQP
ncbi:MAG: hypothetical protein KIT09_19880 [Bryobacteraceae bacterium]|nr:hypothetical protein [Bryobacteraceae bacterium]